NSKARVNLSYSDRYRQAYGSNGMRTMYGSGDMSIPLGGPNQSSFLGVGVNFYNHKVGENSIMDNVASAFVSYRMMLDKDKKHAFSAGFNFTYWNRKYGYSDLQFGNQYDGIYYNPSINSGE